jgi:hypothetical protein
MVCDLKPVLGVVEAESLQHVVERCIEAQVALRVASCSFRRGGKLVGVAIVEAPTLYHARTRVAVRGIGKAVDYSDAKKLDDGDAALVPANCMGRLLLAEEAQQLSDRICAVKAGHALQSVEPVDR